jgi:MFS family permease
LNKTGSPLPFGIPRDLAVLAVSMFIWGLGEGLFIYFFPLALQRWNSDPVLIGGVLSMIGVTMAVVQVPAGYLSDRFGTRPLIRAALILGILAAVIMAAAQTLTIFIVGLIAYGLTSFIGAPLNSYITSMRGQWSIQRAVTFVSGSMQLGAIVGPILGGWIGGTAGFSTVFRYSAGLFLVSTLVIFFARRPVVQETQEETSVPMASPLANPRFIGLLVIIFITIFALSMPQQLTSLYLQEVHHLTLQQIGITGTLAGMGTAMIMFVLGSLRASTGMIVGQVLIGLFSLLMWRGQNAAVFYTGYLFIGGYRLYRSMALAIACPLVKAQDVGLAYGLLETGNALAVILAPLAAGLLYNYKPEAIYTVGLVGLVITIAINTLLLPKKQMESKIECP